MTPRLTWCKGQLISEAIFRGFLVLSQMKNTSNLGQIIIFYPSNTFLLKNIISGGFFSIKYFVFKLSRDISNFFIASLTEVISSLYSWCWFQKYQHFVCILRKWTFFSSILRQYSELPNKRACSLSSFFGLFFHHIWHFSCNKWENFPPYFFRKSMKKIFLP